MRLQLVGAGFDELLDATAAGRVDSAISGLTAAPHRGRELAFSTPYYEAGVMMAVPAGSAIGQQSDVAGQRVAAEWGSQSEAALRTWLRQQEISTTLILRETPQASMDAAVAGAADVVVVDAVSLALYNRDNLRLHPVGAPLQSEPYVIVTAARAGRLLSAINEALFALEADGTLARLKREYVGP